MQAKQSPGLPRLQPVLIALGVLVVLVSLVGWGGTATPGPKFVLGVSVLLGLIAAFVGLGWWLLASKLPAGARIQPITGAGTIRAFAAAMACSSGLLFISGGLWDEIWHRKYGGFGNDFLWPPHLLLYSSIGLIALLACGALIVLALRGSGSLRERVRAEPLIGLVALTAMYLISSLPSDELWHRIYGQDITAWSLPHVILVSGIAGVMMASLPLALSSVPRDHRRGLMGLQAGEWVALALIAWATTMFLQIGTAEWESIRAIGQGSGDAYRAAFWQRPEWLFPVVVVAIALFCGRLAQAVIGRVGAASVVGVIVLAFRLLLMAASGAGEVRLSFTPHLLILPAMIALDAWAWFTRDRQPLAGHLVGSLVFLAVALPLIPSLMIYPRVNADTLPGMIVMGLLMGVAAGAAGSGLGGMLSRLGARDTALTVDRARVRTEGWTALGGLVLAAVIVVVSVSVATPPILR